MVWGQGDSLRNSCFVARSTRAVHLAMFQPADPFSRPMFSGGAMLFAFKGGTVPNLELNHPLLAIAEHHEIDFLIDRSEPDAID